MPVIFEASARSSVATKILHLLVSVFVTGLFGFVAWFFDDLFARIVMLFFVVIGVAIIRAVVRDLIAYAKADGGWRVEIDNFALRWQSPVEKLFRSFTVKLSDIRDLRFVQVSSGGTKVHSARRVFFIHLKNGKTMEIPPQEGGVWVGDVFEALEEKGIRYHRESLDKVNFNREKKQLDIIPMKAW